MIVDILLAVVLLVCLVLLGRLAWRKLPELRVVDPASSKEAKMREAKYAILRKRLERLGTEKASAIRRSILAPFGLGVQNAVRRVASKLTALERQYEERQRGGVETTHNPEVLRGLVREAAELIDEERYELAEKKLIEVVSHDPKNVAAYEKLGRLYLLTKDYTDAKETFSFLSKLSPKDASVLASLGEVSEAQGNITDALRYYKEALEISPNNPKYLDFYINVTIEQGDVHEAMTALDRLRDANPDNAKIGEFEARIDDLRQRKLQK